MHVALLHAGMQRGKDFARIEQACVIERAFETLLLRQIRVREHRRHQIALLHADAVFAGQDAADFDAQFQDRRAECFCTRKLARFHHVEDDERMQVSVAGVEKRDLMPVMFGAHDLAQQQRLKCAFDGKGLFNPGKVFPTPAACVEQGHMHVRGGRIPFPNLPRF